MAVTTRQACDRGPAIDPTKNVLDLVDASVRRLNDLLELQVKGFQELRETDSADIRAMVAMQAAHLKEVADLRATHQLEMEHKESQRIDANREVDMAANLSDRAAADVRANTLAATVANSAEAMRAQVAVAASAASDNLDRRLDPIQKSIEEIRRFQYEAQGGRAQTVETKNESQSKSSNMGLWVGVGLAAFFGLLSLVLAVLGLVLL